MVKRTLAWIAVLAIVGPAGAQEPIRERVTIHGPHLDGRTLMSRRPETKAGAEGLTLLYRTSRADTLQDIGRLVRWTEMRIEPDYGSVRVVDGVEVTDTATAASIYDFALDRVYIVNERAKRFVNISAFARVAQKEQRFNDRLRTLQAQSRFNSGRRLTNETLFWAQAEAGLTTDEYSLSIAESRTTEDGGFEAFLGGQLIASAELTADTERNRWTRTERDIFVKTLRYHVRVHPSVLALINNLPRIPGKLTLVEQVDWSRTYHQWALVDAERTPSRQPFDREYESELNRIAGLTQDFIDNFGERMISAARGEAGGGPSTEEDFANRIKAALDKGDAVEGALVYNLAKAELPDIGPKCRSNPTAAPICEYAYEAGRLARADPRVEKMASAAALERSHLYGAAATQWREIEADDLDGSAMIDLAVARSAIDTYMSSERNERDLVLDRAQSIARFRLIQAMEKAPYLPALYAVVGDYYRAQGDYIAAWIAYDLGRSLPGRSGGEAFAYVAGREEEMLLHRRDYLGR